MANASIYIGDTHGVKARLTSYNSRDIIVVFLSILLFSIDAKGNESLVHALEPSEFQMNDWKKTLSGNDNKSMVFGKFLNSNIRQYHLKWDCHYYNAIYL